MKEVAILIMAHKNQAQLELLIENLLNNFALYIHIDTKSTIDISQLKSMYPTVNFYSEYNINWSGFNQIQCPLYLFRKAHQQKHRYYILISAQDLPIVSNEKIIESLSNGECSYVVSDKLPLPQWKFNGGFDRVQLYWESDITGNSLYANLRRRIIGHIRKRQRMYNWRRPLYSNMEYYGGSNWVILKADAMSYLINFIDKHPRYIKSFRYSYCADELWVQTILATSDCNIKNEHFTYLNWQKGPEYPRTLRSDDYIDIISSPCLFARKFDIEVDSEIIRKILQHRNSL